LLNRVHSAAEIKKICLDAGADDVGLVDLNSKYLREWKDLENSLFKMAFCKYRLLSHLVEEAYTMRDEDKAREQLISELEELRRQVTESKSVFPGPSSTDFIRQVINYIRTPVFVKDENHRWVFLNDAACEMMEHPREYLIGKSDYDLFPKEQADVFWEKDDLVLRAEEPNLNEETITWRGRVHTICTIKNRFFDPFTKKNYIVGVIQDITERKQTEEALRESEERFRMIFDHSPLGLVHFDQNGVIVECNQRFIQIMGSSKEKLLGFSMLKSLQDEKMRTAVLTALSGDIGYYEGDYLSVTGNRLISLRTIYSQITAEDGRFLGALGIFEDVTERKQAEEALHKSKQELRDLSSRLLIAQEEERKRIAGELHDSIGASLSSIKYGIEGLLEQVKKDEAGFQVLNSLVSIVQSTIEDARRMMSDLRPPMIDDLGIIPTIHWFIRQFRTIYSHISVEEEIDIGEKEIPVPLKIVLFRILQEALHNIAKYSNANLARLSLTRRGNQLEVVIQDNGIGFDVHAACKVKKNRGGLGLASMRERAELSGGSFSIDSTAGEGTTIRASWPWSRDEDASNMSVG
jgi:PAS domain S-box-containing protein